MASEVDKCYLCDLLGDFEEFNDVKKQFDAQHVCWKQNESKKVVHSEIVNHQIEKLAPNAIELKLQNEVSEETAQVINPKIVAENPNKCNDVHKCQEKHKCKSCLKSFSQVGTLKKHIHTVHERKLTARCYIIYLDFILYTLIYFIL